MNRRVHRFSAKLSITIVLLTANALMSNTASAALLSHWKFDETGGTTATDEVLGLAGTLEAQTGGGATPTFVPGKFGNAVFMDGVGGDSNNGPRMIVNGSGGDEAAFNFGTGDFSIAFWLKAAGNYGIVSSDHVVTLGYDGGDERLFIPVRTPAQNYRGIYQRFFGPGFSNSSGDVQPSSDRTATVIDGDWHHYAITTDRDGDGTVYIDGNDVGSGAVSGASAANDMSGTTNFLNLGRDQYHGAIDDLRFYSHVLDPSEVQDLFFPSQPPATIFQWRDDVSGDWNGAGNWMTDGQGSVPNGTAHTAIFGDAVASNTRTVFTDRPLTVNSIRFENTMGGGYRITGGPSIHLAATTSLTPLLPSLTVSQGSHEFQAPVLLHDDTTVNVGSGSTLIFHNALDLMSHTLSKTGRGEMAIRNDLIAGGGTVDLQEGTITGNGTVGGDVNNHSGTISPGNSLSVTSVVPEPTSLLLLILGSLGIVGRMRQKHVG